MHIVGWLKVNFFLVERSFSCYTLDGSQYMILLLMMIILDCIIAQVSFYSTKQPKFSHTCMHWFLHKANNHTFKLVTTTELKKVCIFILEECLVLWGKCCTCMHVSLHVHLEMFLCFHFACAHLGAFIYVHRLHCACVGRTTRYIHAYISI